MLAAAAPNSSAVDLALGIGPFALLAIFAAVYFFVHIKVMKGRPGLLSRIGIPVLFMMLGYLMTPGNTADMFLPQLILRFFGNRIQLH